MTSMEKSSTFPHHVLRSLLSDAIVELCRREAFYVEELRIEGTICVVSDRTAALIVQITEQVGNKTETGAVEEARNVPLPTVMTTAKVDIGVSTQSMTYTDGELPHVPKRNNIVPRKLRACRHCGAHFVRLGSLRSHVRRRHPNSMSFAGNIHSRQLHSVLPPASYNNSTEKTSTAEQCSNGNTAAASNQNLLMNTMKLEPETESEVVHSFGSDINLGLQQMVRTLSMMSSFPVSGSSHFPGFSVPVSATPAAVEDDPVQLRRSADGKFACPYCTKTYGFKHSLKEHIDVHRGRRPHVCRHCGSAFAHLASLCAHIRRRHDDRMPAEFRCSLCGEKLMNLQSLKQHRTWRHKDAPRLSDPLPLPPASSLVSHGSTDMSSAATVMNHSSEDKKDALNAASEAGHANLATSQWSAAFPGNAGNRNGGGMEADLDSKMHSARSGNMRKDTGDLSSFEGFDFRNYLPSDFLSATAPDWSAATDHGAVTANDQNEGSLASINSDHPRHLAPPSKFMPVSELPGMQLPSRGGMSYRSFSEDVFMRGSVCPGCCAKFRTDAEYRRHLVCNPDHMPLSWRQ